MFGWEEHIVLQRLAIEYDSSVDDLNISIQGQFQDVEEVELREIKIGLDVPDQGSANLNWITMEIKNPGGGLISPNGLDIVLVPELVSGGTVLFKEFHKNNVTLLRLNSKKSTNQSRKLKLRFRDQTGKILTKTFVYLRLGVKETGHLESYLQDLDQDRFAKY